MNRFLLHTTNWEIKTHISCLHDFLKLNVFRALDNFLAQSVFTPQFFSVKEYFINEYCSIIHMLVRNWCMKFGVHCIIINVNAYFYSIFCNSKHNAYNVFKKYSPHLELRVLHMLLNLMHWLTESFCSTKYKASTLHVKIQVTWITMPVWY